MVLLFNSQHSKAKIESGLPEWDLSLGFDLTATCWPNQPCRSRWLPTICFDLADGRPRLAVKIAELMVLMLPLPKPSTHLVCINPWKWFSKLALKLFLGGQSSSSCPSILQRTLYQNDFSYVCSTSPTITNGGSTSEISSFTLLKMFNPSSTNLLWSTAVYIKSFPLLPPFIG